MKAGTTRQVSVSEFKAHCTSVLREVAATYHTVEVTRHGKVVAVVGPPPPRAATNPAWGALRGTTVYVAPDFDAPLGDEEWEAAAH